MFNQFTVGKKILLSLASIVVLVAGSNYFILITEQRSISQGFASDLTLINNSERQLLEGRLEEIKKRAVDFSSDGYIRDTVKEFNTKKNSQLSAALNNYLVNNKLALDPSLLGINILSNDGVIIASTNPDEMGKDESHDEYFPGTEDLSYGSVYMSDFMVAHHFTEKVASLIVAAPLTDKISGTRIGTMMNFVNAKDVATSLEKHVELFARAANSYGSVHAYIATRNGIVVDHGNADPALMLSQKIDPAIKCGEITSYSNSMGIAVKGLGTCLDNRWTLVTEISEKEAMAPLTIIQRELFGMAAMLIIVVLLILYVLNRRIIRPMHLLSLAAQKIGEGHLDVRTHIKSNDEIGDLSNEFDEMAKKMQESHITLAQKVKEVTQDFEKFKLAVEGASDHVVITDTDGKIIYANRAAEETTGYSREEMLGERPSLWGKQMPQEFYQRMWRIIKERQESFHSEVTNRRKNGDLYVAEVHISPLFNEAGMLYGFVAIERDITKQKEIDKSKTEFVSIASHQLRTPLTIINWYVEMLSTPGSEQLSKKQLQYLDEITRASKRMIELVNSLLNVSRIDMGTFMVEPIPMNFVDALEDALKDLLAQISHKKITVMRKFDKDLPLISADPKLLRMVLQNLLTNAVKYTPNDGVITVSIEHRMADILITIADTGMGIPLQQQSKIFQKFFRADNARIKEPDGNGLGLYIIKSIVENGGGKIWFTSEENKGAAFYVSIPIEGMKKKEGTRVLAI